MRSLACWLGWHIYGDSRRLDKEHVELTCVACGWATVLDA